MAKNAKSRASGEWAHDKSGSSSRAKFKAPASTGVTVVVRSEKSGRFLGQTSDGTRILRPAFKPQDFTIRELEKAIGDVRRAAAKAS